MTPEELLRSKALFFEAIELDRDERAAWLDAQPDLSKATRAQLELQLRLYDSEPDLAPVAEAATPEQVLADPETIGRYRVLHRLGEGGMGIVYACQQDEPVRRQVAVKRLKAGMDSAAIARRFEAERQALARMSHPAIAQVFDGGVDAAGRPYFAMELVDGESITRYADARRLGVDARIKLFVALCRGVEHAHRRGVLHRDLKPANVLVTEVDGEPVPKIIDFGIAKAIGESLGAESMHTRHGAVLGTPDYMSPEQATAGMADVDTRSDVYSLGVVLYELLTGERPRAGGTDGDSAAGTPPLSREDAPGARAVDHERPSARFRRATEDSAARAALRTTTVPGLRRMLRRDLDWIALCALQRDRERRYDSVGAFAADLERFRAQEPVLAGPPSLRYRLSRGVRRHRVAVATALAIGASLITGAAFAVYYALDADRARAAAESDLYELYDGLSRQAARAEFHGSPYRDRARLQELQGRIVTRFEPDFEAVRGQVDDYSMTIAGVVGAIARRSEYLRGLAERHPPVVRLVIADILHRTGVDAFEFGLFDEAFANGKAASALRDQGGSRFDPRVAYSRLLVIDALLGMDHHEKATATISAWLERRPAGAVDAQLRARLGAARIAAARSTSSAEDRDRLLDDAERLLSRAQAWLSVSGASTRGAWIADDAWIELQDLRGQRDRATEAIERLRAAAAQYAGFFPFTRRAVGFGPGSDELWESVKSLVETAPRSLAERTASFASLRDVCDRFAVADDDPRWRALLHRLVIAANLHGNHRWDETSHAICELTDRIATAQRARSGVIAFAAFFRSLSLLEREDVDAAEERARFAASIPEVAHSEVRWFWACRHHWGWCLALRRQFDVGLERLVEGWAGLADIAGPADLEFFNASDEFASMYAAWHQADADAARASHDRLVGAIERVRAPRYRVAFDVALAFAASQRFDREEVLVYADRARRSQALRRRHALSLGVALSRAGELDRAVDCLRIATTDAVLQSPGRAAATFCVLGGIFLRHGRLDAARDAYDEAAELVPGHGGARDGLAAVDRAGGLGPLTEHDGLELPVFVERYLFGRRFHSGELTVRSRLRFTANPGQVWFVYLQALARHGRVDEARALCDRLVADPFRDLYTLEGIARFLALTEGLSEADRRRGLEVARDAYERSGRGMAPRIEASLAEAELATGARERAIERLGRLRDSLSRKSAEWITPAEVERRIRELGR